MINVLVTCVNYPHGDVHIMQYVHVRNLYYKEHGFNVSVLNFNAKECYSYEGIDVITYEHFKKNVHMYKGFFLICHAPNIRNHYMFIKRFGKIFDKHMFFFHGHEIVKINEMYGKPYPYAKKSKIRNLIQDVYDSFKIRTWKNYLKSHPEEICVFVSNSLYNDFLDYTGLSRDYMDKRVFIINNAISTLFEKNKYSYTKEKEYDFITIRSDMDSPIYCIDLITQIAEKNSDKSFLIIGEGRYYDYNKKPDNITWVNGQLSHEDLLSYIDKAKCALMPTRRDSQGLMSCELSSYGIKVFTSDLGVCHEMFDEFENVILLSEEELLNFQFADEEYKEYKINEKFYCENTMRKEVELIESSI